MLTYKMDRAPACILLLFSILFNNHSFPLFSLAAPIPPPDLTDCHPPSDFPEGEPLFNCCAPTSHKPPIPFHPNHTASSSRLRVRRPTHAVDREYANKLNRAYQLMKALPPDDPRSFMQQANIHCAYCNAVYRHRNTSAPFQVHASWLFFPFHRWYLYFHERILANLLQDDTFALSFWNYDNEIGSTIPWMFLEYPYLNDSLRDVSHLPPAVAQMDSILPCNCTGQEQVGLNARIMYHVMISGGRTPRLFLGMPYRFGDDPRPGFGTAEWFPHNKVHVWVGDRSQVGIKDMGSLYAAARDPIFYSHHANLDRFWEVWKTIEGHQDFQDPDFLDSEFAFYNENAELVTVRVRDSLSVENLGYVYETVDNTWLKARPSPLSVSTKAEEKGSYLRNASLCKLTAEELLSEPCVFLVDRDIEKQQQPILLQDSTVEEILVVEGIRVKSLDWEKHPAAGFHVFLNSPLANASTTLNCTEFAGSFSFIPQMMGTSGTPTTLRLGIGSTVEELGLGSRHVLSVTIVPMGVRCVSVSGMRLEYEIIHGITSTASI